MHFMFIKRSRKTQCRLPVNLSFFSWQVIKDWLRTKGWPTECVIIAKINQIHRIQKHTKSFVRWSFWSSEDDKLIRKSLSDFKFNFPTNNFSNSNYWKIRDTWQLPTSKLFKKEEIRFSQFMSITKFTFQHILKASRRRKTKYVQYKKLIKNFFGEKIN